MAITIINNWIFARNFKSYKETYSLPGAIRKLRRNWEVSCYLRPVKVWGEFFFPKKALGKKALNRFMRDRLKSCSLVCRWRRGELVWHVTSLLKRYSWEAGGRRKLCMVRCHSYIYGTWKSQEAWRQGRF